MNNSDTNRNLIKLLELLNEFNKKDLKNLLNEFKSDEISKINKQSKFGFLSLADKNKIDIIGGLPFLLNSKKYFKTHNDIKEFSEKFLRIPIPKGNKSKKELIGIIVVGIAELPPKETQRIKDVLNEVMEKVTTGETENIFLEWKKAISSIEFKR